MDFTSGDGLMATARFAVLYLTTIGVIVACFRFFEAREQTHHERVRGRRSTDAN